MENLTGTVERIVYQNDENHWTVARLKLAETNTRYRAAQDLTTIVGPMPGINVGETNWPHAGWVEADRLGPASSWRMVRAFVLNAPYPSAPFSTLYLFGRGQDIGFQK